MARLWLGLRLRRCLHARRLTLRPCVAWLTLLLLLRLLSTRLALTTTGLSLRRDTLHALRIHLPRLVDALPRLLLSLRASLMLLLRLSLRLSCLCLLRCLGLVLLLLLVLERVLLSHQLLRVLLLLNKLAKECKYEGDKRTGILPLWRNWWICCCVSCAMPMGIPPPPCAMLAL